MKLIVGLGNPGPEYSGTRHNIGWQVVDAFAAKFRIGIGNEARSPRIEVKNRSNRPVKYVELGWVVSDQAGKQYMAGSLPSSEASLNIPPGQTARVLQESSLSFLSDGRPVNVRKMTGFINQVQFADGKVWVPSRESLDNPMLQRTMAPSNEELRLSDLYRRKGIDALMEELKKY